MKIETLIATIDQQDYSLVSKMNIRTDAIVGNQGKRTSREELCLDGKQIIYLNTTNRGVGLNRNLLLENATADICIFADDDMTFVDDYPNIAKKAFEECPDADILIFNLIEKKPKRYINKKIKKVRFNNYAKYGAARIAFKRESVIDAGIQFSLLFGGGTKYGSGEDTIFLKDCLKRGLKIYAVPYYLAQIDQDALSTWFAGYNEKFFYDKGALYACLHPYSWRIYITRYVIRYSKKFKKQVRPFAAYLNMAKGAKEFRLNENIKNN